MISLTGVYPTIPVTDLQRAKNFYEKMLGLEVSDTTPEGVVYSAGGGSKIYLYQREQSKADHTLASFHVEDIEKEIGDLSQKGVAFEHYDFPNLKTDGKGIATMGQIKAAWFKDPDGNILALSQSSK